MKKSTKILISVFAVVVAIIVFVGAYGISLLGKVGKDTISKTNKDAYNYTKISSPGTYTLTGQQALTYSRIRYKGNGDIIKTGTSILFSGMNNLEQERFPLDGFCYILSRRIIAK